SLGAARIASAGNNTRLGDLVETARQKFALDHIKYVGDPGQSITQVALACGSGGSFLGKAVAAGCDAMVTGETTFHTCLEASASGVGLLLLGHYASERFAVERLATVIGDAFADLQVWASEQESDPLQYL
ncbi:MAG: Nif3-like dinuclear metal center hexameric protein, partial [Pirellulaceae bacterium]